MLSWTEIETRASAFQKKWRDSSGTEKQDDQKFIQDFLLVFGVDWQTGFPQHQIFMLHPTPVQKEKIEQTTQANDKAVLDAYGKSWPLDSEPACVAFLMKLCQQLTKNFAFKL